MSERVYTILKAPSYTDWYEQQPFKDRAQIEDRLVKIQNEGYFGIHKSVDENDIIWELKWTGGRRIYYAYIPPQKILLLLGDNKNGQSKDINQAKKVYKQTVTGKN
jgi:putative addiction module killer protein